MTIQTNAKQKFLIIYERKHGDIAYPFRENLHPKFNIMLVCGCHDMSFQTLYLLF